MQNISIHHNSSETLIVFSQRWMANCTISSIQYCTVYAFISIKKSNFSLIVVASRLNCRQIEIWNIVEWFWNVIIVFKSLKFWLWKTVDFFFHISCKMESCAVIIIFILCEKYFHVSREYEQFQLNFGVRDILSH